MVWRVVWSRRQPLGSIGAVLSFLDGPTGCDLAFCVVWFRLRLFVGIWLCGLLRLVVRIRLLELVGVGSPGHGPIHLLSASAEIGFRWDPLALAWSRLGLPLLSNLADPVQHFKAAILDAWRNKVAADLCGREGFRRGSFLDLHGSLQLLNSSHDRERDKALLRSVMVGVVWNGFLQGKVRGQPVPCRFRGAPDGDGHLFWECTFPPLVEIRENPEFHDLMREDKAHWPRCLLWHGWLPMLSGVNGASPWAADASESAFYLVETALGQYSSRLVSEWSLPDGFDADEVSLRLPDSPDIWSDGGMVLDSVTGGAGMFAHQSEFCWRDRRWGHVDRVQTVGVDHSCRAFVSVIGPLQTVQRAELWGSFLLFSLLKLFILVLTILVLFGMLGACWIIVIVPPLLSLLLMVTFLCSFVGCFILVVVLLFVLLRSRVMLMRLLTLVGGLSDQL